MFNLKNNFYLHIINFNHIGLTCVHLFAGKKKKCVHLFDIAVAGCRSRFMCISTYCGILC